MALPIHRTLKAVDFFCGAGGMSFGLYQSGVKVLGGVDNASDCQATYEANVPGAKYLKRDISSLSPKELGSEFGIKRNDRDLIFAGCSPCQFWSKIRTDKSRSKRTAFLLERFERFISHFRPGFVIVENVPGLLTRGKKSALPAFKRALAVLGYSFSDGLVNANHYGVPQNRIRYLLIATWVQRKVDLPKPTIDQSLVVRSFIGQSNGFPSIPAGHRDPSDFKHTCCSLSKKNSQRIRATPKSGGSRYAWRKSRSLQLKAYKGRDDIFRDVYARMYWDRPAPTITTRFISFSNGRFGHPDEDRAISIREGAVLQTFPDYFKFVSSNLNGIARQIGNAVPPELARRIGRQLNEIRDGTV